MKLKHFALAASILILCASARASYYVDEDSAPVVNAVQPAISTTLATFDVGYSIRRSTLGASARHTLQDRLDDIIDADQVVVTGFGDAAGNAGLARQRANTIRQWLIDSGVAQGRISVEEDTSPRRRDASKATVTLKSLASGTAAMPKTAMVARADLTASAVQSPPSREKAPAFDPLVVEMATKIIAMEKGKLLRPEDAYRLLAELLQPRGSGASAQTAVAISPAIIQPAAIVVPVVEQPRAWTLQKGKTLKENLEAWAATAGWAVPEWRASNPYRIAEDHTLNGTFVEVLSQLAGLVPGIDLRVKKAAQTLRVVDAGSDVARR